MRWTYFVGGRPTTLTRLGEVVAVRPRARPAGVAERRRLVRAFGRAAADDSGAIAFGMALPAGDRRRFERAGWLFVALTDDLAAALARGKTVRGAQAVRPVYLDAAGRLTVATDVVVVQLRTELEEEAARRWLAEDGLRLVRPLGFAPRTYEARLLPGRPLEEAVRHLQESGRYDVAEPQFLEVIRGRWTPHDPHFHDQWQHVKLRSEKAWNKTRGCGTDGPVRVAVIDDGMQVSHPDLVAGVVANAAFTCDGMGRIEFRRYPPGDPSFPGGDHGTFCLGLAGARANNGLGGCGSAPEADLMAVACVVDDVRLQLALARAITYATDPRWEEGPSSPTKGADVISCSLGGDGAGWPLNWAFGQALDFATRAGRGGLGIPLFWAVSNADVNVGSDAVCSHPAVIAIGRTDPLDRAAGAHGRELDFVAPGFLVYSTLDHKSYGGWTGTSFATPLAAGVAALVLARYPGWTLHHVRSRLLHSCDKVGGFPYHRGRNDYYGHGRINAARAVR